LPDAALGAAVDWLWARQDGAGWWTGELETNATMTAEHVLLLRFLGLPVDRVRAGAVQHLMAGQREDGSWALFHDGPADLSTTVEAYAALKALGLDPAAEPMRRALRVVLRLGGVARARVFTKIWLALFGQYPWAGVPSMPPELVHLPAWAPLSLYDFASWARATIAPLLIVISRRPVRPLGVDLAELVAPGTEPALTRPPGAGVFAWLDRLQKVYERLPRQPGRAGARRRLVDWIVARQEADGGWGGIQPPWVYSLIALHLEGMGLDHPVLRRGVEGLEGFALEDEGGWRFQACMSPVWDTAWAALALRRAGTPRDDERLERAVRWLLREQVPADAPGDWRVRCPGVPGGGWAFEFENDGCPDVDDTALVVLALREAARPGVAEAAMERAVRWVLAMRSRGGAWAAFDRDNTRELVSRLPFADFGAMLDPPSEDVTAHVLEMLASVGCRPAAPVVAEGLAYLRARQRPAGSWFGRWGVNHVYGTWCAISALTALGSGDDLVRRGLGWLLSVRNPDGGWGETCRSYVDESLAGRGPSTASQTAWAVLSFQAAGLGRHPACLAGLDHLRERQAGGTWEEPQHTGTGFPRDFYLNYHLYRHVFPTLALAGARAGGG